MATERKLPSRRRRKANKGRILRVSNFVYDTLDKLRRNQSWDSTLRKHFGLPDRLGNTQFLVEGVLETMTGAFFLKLPETTWESLEERAYEIAIVTAAKRATKKVSRPLRMRELP